jgi:hypothetical protein
MQNALSNDLSLRSAVTTRNDPPAPRSPYKLQKAIETHQHFLRSYVDGLADESFPSLWGLTHALFAPTESAEWMTSRLDLVRSGTAPQFVEAMAPALHRALDASVASVAAEITRSSTSASRVMARVPGSSAGRTRRHSRRPVLPRPRATWARVS